VQSYHSISWVWRPKVVGNSVCSGNDCGQAGYFIHRAPEPVPAAAERFTLGAEQLYRVVKDRLAESPFLGGDDSIADIAAFPWLRKYGRYCLEIGGSPNVARWRDIVGARPAVERALELP